MTRSCVVSGFVRWPLSSLLQNPFKPPQIGKSGVAVQQLSQDAQMAGTHVSVDVPTPTPVWDPGQQRMAPFPQLQPSAVNSTWLQQHVPCPAKGQLMTSLLLAQRVPVQRLSLSGNVLARA